MSKDIWKQLKLELYEEISFFLWEKEVELTEDIIDKIVELLESKEFREMLMNKLNIKYDR